MCRRENLKSHKDFYAHRKQNEEGHPPLKNVITSSCEESVLQRTCVVMQFGSPNTTQRSRVKCMLAKRRYCAGPERLLLSGCGMQRCDLLAVRANSTARGSSETDIQVECLIVPEQIFVKTPCCCRHVIRTPEAIVRVMTISGLPPKVITRYGLVQIYVLSKSPVLNHDFFKENSAKIMELFLYFASS